MKYNKVYKVYLDKTSKYNSNKIKGVYEKCKQNLATEIHHLEYQKCVNGFINANDSNFTNHS